MKERKKHMIKIDIRAKNVAYITIGKWVLYVDDSTGEQIIDSWKNKSSKPQATSSPQLESRIKK